MSQFCNSSAALYDINEQPLWENGLTFHRLITYISAGLAFIAIVVSLYSIWLQSLTYTRPFEQRHIIRILFMVPVYSLVSLLSIVFYQHAVYFELASDTYSAIAVASFFALMIHYVAPSLHEQKEYFRSVHPKPWRNSWPLMPLKAFQNCCGGSRGPWRTPRSGLTWYNAIFCGVYQYCLIRIAMSIVAVVTQPLGKYCELSNNPKYAHIWVLIFDAISSTIAMYFLESFYEQLKAELAHHKITFKLYCVKMVFSLSLYQNLLMSLLTSSWLPARIRDDMAPSAKVNAFDIKIGIPCLLLSFELAIISVLHLFAFPWKVYKKKATTNLPQPNIDLNYGGPVGIVAILDAMNPWDLVKALGRSARWLLVGRKHRETDVSYANARPPDLDLEFSSDRFLVPNFGSSMPSEQAKTTHTLQYEPVVTGYNLEESPYHPREEYIPRDAYAPRRDSQDERPTMAETLGSMPNDYNEQRSRYY